MLSHFLQSKCEILKIVLLRFSVPLSKDVKPALSLSFQLKLDGACNQHGTGAGICKYQSKVQWHISLGEVAAILDFVA